LKGVVGDFLGGGGGGGGGGARHESIGGNGGTAAVILNLGTQLSYVFSFTSWPLYPQEKVPTSDTCSIGGCVGPTASLGVAAGNLNTIPQPNTQY